MILRRLLCLAGAAAASAAADSTCLASGGACEDPELVSLGQLGRPAVLSTSRLKETLVELSDEALLIEDSGPQEFELPAAWVAPKAALPAASSAPPRQGAAPRAAGAAAEDSAAGHARVLLATLAFVLWARAGAALWARRAGAAERLVGSGEAPEDGGTVDADEPVGDKTQVETEKSAGASGQKPVYVGCVKEGDYQGLLYFDSGSTGTRPYVFIRRSADASVSEFWQLAWAQEVRQVRIHTCVSSEAHGNEELLRRLRGSPDEEGRLGLLEGLRLSQEFTDYIADAISQAGSIVSSSMQAEAGHGVKFWSNGSALLISDIVVAITGGLRSAVGESPAVLREVDARLTGLLSSRLQQAKGLGGVRLVAKLLPGSEEARCEAAAVRVLSAMQGSASLGGAASGVISMGGASVQVSVNGTSLCIPMGRNRAIEAAHKADGEPGHLDDFRAEFAAARAAALADHLELIESPRTWIAVSGLYYTARDLGIRLEQPLDLAEARAELRARALARESEAGEGEDPAAVDARAGSAACALEVLATLSGLVVFQREWLNPTTNQRLAATVSTGYVVSHLGYAGELPTAVK